MGEPLKHDSILEIINKGAWDPPSTEASTAGAETLHIDLLKTVRVLLVISFITVYFLITSICNTAALLILFQRSFMRNAFAMGQRFLAIFDLVLSFVTMFSYVVKWMYVKNDISQWDDNVCRAYKMTYFITVGCTNWTIVYLTGLRYISIKSPVKINTYAFNRRAFYTLLFTSLFITVYYVLFYHEFTRNFYKGKAPAETDECFSFENFPVNEFVFRIAMMLPEIIAPGIGVVCFNYLLYKEFLGIGIRRRLLRHELAKHCRRISEIKNSLTGSDLTVKNFTDMKKNSQVQGDLNFPNLGRGKSSDQVDEGGSVGSDKFIINTISGLSGSQMIVNVDNEGRPIDNGKHHLLEQLKTEKSHLRRATIAYDLLVDIEGASLRESTRHSRSRSGARRKGEAKELVMDSLCRIHREKSINKPLTATRYGDSTAAFRKLLTLNSLLFILLYGPYCMWYILSTVIYSNNPLDRARNELLNTIVIILQCLGHSCNFLVYIYSSTKVRQEGARLYKKYTFTQANHHN